MTPERWARMKEIFGTALEMPERERAAYLDAACAGDSELRSEIDRLLAEERNPEVHSPVSGMLRQPQGPVNGAMLGRYRIEEKLGEGGMGVVYRARDSRLKREVAIKVLPVSFACDPDRIARFEREARAASALNHPNIVSVFDIGRENSTYWIVSELVDGETLGRTIDRGPLPVRKAVEIAVQIAEGLAAAHAAGIVHRDLKPANIMVTRDGRVKILDFGLALRRHRSQDSTMLELTGEGTVLGTAGYMSPEQVRGEEVDQRSDLFSFGVILYEMLAGKQAFSGSSSIEVMNAILKDDPPELPPSVPPSLERVVRRCLEKHPGQRFQSAADLAFALRSISNITSSPTAMPSAKPERRFAWIKPAVMAVAAVLLAAGGYWLLDRIGTGNPPEFQRLTFRQGHISAARFVGDAVLYAANWEEGPGRIYLVTPGNPESRDLTMPENSRLLSVTPAGDIALLVGPFDPDGSGTLARNSVTGGQTRELLEHVMAADWTADGRTGAVTRRVDGVWRLEFPEGNVTWKSQWPAYGLRISPDGQRVAFCVYDQGSRAGIMTLDWAGTRKYLGVVSSQISMVESARLFWSPNGEEIWFRSLDSNDLGTIYGLSLKGKRRMIARFPGEVTLDDLSPGGQALITTDSTRVGILAVAPGETTERDLSVLDASELASISQDGRTLLANVVGASGGPRGSIYLRRTDGSPPVRLGAGKAFGFSPDGKWLTGYTTPDAIHRDFVLLPTGTGEEKNVAVPGLNNQKGIIVGWLPGDQNYLVMGALAGNTKNGWQLFAFDAVKGTLRAVSPQGMSGEGTPRLSPDRKRYYHQGPDGQWHVYSIADGKQSDLRGLTERDIPAGWRADNHSIYVQMHSDAHNMMRVAILNIDTGERKPWKEIHPARPVDEVSSLCVTPDGRAYAYNYRVATSELYLVKGLK